jgi:DNA processing protein
MRVPGVSDAHPGIALRRLASSDEEYPAQLREVPSAPAALWCIGRITADDALAVAVVGSRRATPYGIEIAERLSGDLAARGITVVSGLARGIDAAAHRGALAAGGRTIAVLGSGVDVIYPPEHRGFAQRIAERGAVVSQFAPGTAPLPHRFPERNRVIAGLALGVVVVEATERSGALITAGFAAELGRDVMAVPGRVTSPESSGAHRLIQDGAALVTRWQDVVAQLPARWRDCVRTDAPAVSRPADGLDRGGAPAPMPADGDAHRILSALGDEPATIDDVIEKSGIGSGRAAALLLELELAGRVRQLGGQRFVAAGG